MTKHSSSLARQQGDLGVVVFPDPFLEACYILPSQLAEEGAQSSARAMHSSRWQEDGIHGVVHVSRACL